MHVDSAVELGRDDPALEIPWASEDGRLRYFDIRRNPELIDSLPEVRHWSELREFLIRANAPNFPLQTAKSDVWTTTEISLEEEIFGAGWKFACYVDLVFSAEAPRFSLQAHQELTKKLCLLLQRAPEMPATIEFVIRHCYYHVSGTGPTVADPEESGKQGCSTSMASYETKDGSSRGFCLTSHVSGFGNAEEEARQRWSIAFKLLQYALVQAVHS